MIDQVEILPPEIIEVMEACAFSTGDFAKVMFPERFYRPFSSLHKVIFDAIDDPIHQKVLIMAPRGFGKTSTCTIGYPARNIVYGHKKFIVPISATSKSAILQSENLKRELLQNPSVEAMFGPQKTDSWSKEEWISSQGSMIMPRGAGQQVRGLLHGSSRPDLIICDDLETAEGVRSDEQRAKLLEWFLSDVSGSVDMGSKDWKIVVIGTVLHEDCLLLNLMKDPSWHVVQLELCNDRLESNWPDFMSNEAVQDLYDYYSRMGKLDTFYREYRNKPISAEDAVFKKEFFKYYSEPLDRDENRDLVNIIIMDYAKTVKMHSAESAVVCVGVSRSTQKIYVRDIIHAKLYPDELYEAVFSLALTWNASVIAYEETGLNEFITQPMKNEASRRGCFATLIPLKARGKKEMRIAQLNPYYRSGFIYHNPEKCKVLEAQLLSYPCSALWDVMDAFCYIIPIMDEEYQYFYPPDWSADSPEMDKEFEDLLNEKLLERESYL